jgi:4-amino-4-deoxy-L-arabinose transferase-like glycosyltransferase
LQGGLWLIGIGYNSPDMVAYGLTAAAGWLTLRVARGERGMREVVGLGVVLGLGYLDRTAFAPLCAVYLGVMWFLIRQVRPLLVSAAIMVAIGAPFAVAISLKKGAPTIGESGKLNYGWEVDGAVRSTHWQGEPGDIGQPEHPTRLLIKEPVPVYEFGSPWRASILRGTTPRTGIRGSNPV